MKTKTSELEIVIRTPTIQIGIRKITTKTDNIIKNPNQLYGPKGRLLDLKV